MKSRSEKGSQNSSRKRQSRPVQKKRAVTSNGSQSQSLQQIERLQHELAEAELRETATSEVLRAIASSAKAPQSVLNAVAQYAARLTDAHDAIIHRLDGDVLRDAAHYGPISRSADATYTPLNRGSVAGRAVVDRCPVHVHDMQAESDAEFPLAKSRAMCDGTRSVLGAPLLRDGIAIGAILIRRTEIRPFTDKQLTVLQTFADQAVIAIENARLFNELGARNRQLTEALEQQTATSEILGVIASSPTDIQPVLDTIAQNAARLCGADDAVIRLIEGDMLAMRAHYGPFEPEILPRPIDRRSVVGRVVVDRQLIHIEDLMPVTESEFPESQASTERGGIRTVLAAPLQREGVPIGLIFMRRTEVCPFTDKQIALVQTFADQAVIAMENVRLFQELTESLEQQKATSEILGVIASSATDIQPVLDAIAKNAARVCNANDASIRLVEENMLRLAAHHGPIPFFAAAKLPVDRDSVAGRAYVERRVIHIEDLLAVVASEYPRAQTFTEQEGTRTVMVVPLMREDVPIGTVMIRRTEVRPFADKQIALLKTFADQAVIAIENVRLFKELQQRNTELREALEHQTATAEVLSIISHSPTDVQPVLDAIVESAARVCGVDDMTLRLCEGNVMVVRAHVGSLDIPAGREGISVDEPRMRWISERGTLHIPDVQAQNDFPTLTPGGWRAYLAVPLRQSGEFIGGLFARRIEANPFTPVQIKLLETFANQAVIALENARLFNELKESLEQQTATSEILRVIASSPTDLQPVLNTMAEHAACVCGSYDAMIRLVQGDSLHVVAHHGPVPPGVLDRPIDRTSVNGRAVIDRQIVHIDDSLALAKSEFPGARSDIERLGLRTLLSVPLMREDSAIGVISIRRTEVRPFTEKQIAL